MSEEVVAESRRDVLRTAFVDAAEAIVAERGLPALRARDLAQATGRALGTLYTVFPDLDALALEVNRRTLALFEAHVAGLDAPSDDAPSHALPRLALAYLDFAAAHGPRWRALFLHRMAGGDEVPGWYVEAQAGLFRLVEAPLAALRPELGDEARALLARTLFSAVHGMVSLGLDERLMTLPGPVLRAQIETVVTATAQGLAARSVIGAGPLSHIGEGQG